MPPKGKNPFQKDDALPTVQPTKPTVPLRTPPGSSAAPNSGPTSKPPSGAMGPAKLDWLDQNAGKSAEHSQRRAAYLRRLARGD